jgi:hypothetical protein
MTDESREGAALRAAFVRRCGKPIVLGGLLFLAHLALPAFVPEIHPDGALAHTFVLAIIFAVAWFLVGVVRVAEE